MMTNLHNRIVCLNCRYGFFVWLLGTPLLLNERKMTGILASAMFVCMIFSSLVWGYVCDKWGRKVSIYLCGGGLALTTTLFGFSYNYTWALISRSSQGLFLGLIVITKAVISDVSDDSNLGAGMTFIFAAFNLGLILGPSMAGFLAFPAEKFPKVFNKDSFFGKLKIFFPNLILASWVFISILIAAFFIPKNTQKAYENKKVVVEDPKEESSILNTDPDVYFNYSMNSTIQSNCTIQFSESSQLLTSHSPRFSFFQLKNTAVGKLLRYQEFLLVLIVYWLQATAIVGYEELFPVHAATDLHYSGYGMSESEIGLLFLIVSSFVLLLQLTVVNNVMNRFGAKKTFSASALAVGLFIALIPTVGMIKHKIGFWIMVCFNQVLIRLTMASGFLAINVILNNCVDSSLLGTANGLAMSITAVGRSIGPTAFGSAYSWSLGNVENTLQGKKGLGFPFNEYFAFLVIGFSMVFVFLLATRIPESFNKRKIYPEEILVIVKVLIRLVMASGFLSINVILNNCVDSSLLGTANGLAMSITAVGRSIGPTAFGSAYSWSLGNVENTLQGKKGLGFPFNEYFAFLVIGFTAVFLFLLATRIPESFNKKKIYPEEIPVIVKASYFKLDNSF